MKRVTKGRSDNLCKGGTQRAGGICGAVRLHSQLAGDGSRGSRDMAELVNHSALLCRHQQQQKA
jgi:hypothetical protein